jgi:hypothetical protein
MACSGLMKASGCFWGKLCLAGGGFSWDERMQESGRFTVYYLFGGAFYYSVRHGVKVQTGYYNYRPFNRSLASAFAQPFLGLSLEIGKLKSL